ncbi:hypothetical protein GCM10009092_37600 [Bowmanella denitrificans]|uniref:Ice-binding protein C-terminal domain-containing protein n=1 Tax=Bowmanella denitrificans TaxID=366582 RepID=A0ABN0XQC9_9ALTE
MNAGKIFSRTTIAAGLLAFSGLASASTITFNDTGLGGDNVFSFDSISLLSYNAQVTLQDTDGDGTLLGPGNFVEIGLTGAVSFNTESGTTQSPIDPTITGLNTEYQLFFDLTVTGTAAFALGLSPFGAPQLAGLINFNNIGSSIDLYYDTDTAAGMQGSATLISTGGLKGNNGCSVVSNSTVAAGDVLGSCLLGSEFQPISGVFFDEMGRDLNSLIGLVPLALDFDINVDRFFPALEFVFPGGAGSSQTFTIQHDGSVKIVVPEPASIAILGLGLFGLGMARRRK